LNKKIHTLFLPKWYPNKFNNLLGIFTYKHALSASQSNKVSVVYVCKDSSLDKTFNISNNYSNGINEVIVYFKPSKFKLINGVKKIRAYKKGINLIHNFNIIHAHVFLFPVLIAYLVSVYKKIPFVVSEHWTGYRKGSFSKMSVIKKALTIFLAKKARYVLPVSTFLKNDMKNCGIVANYRLLGNVVEIKNFYSKKNAEFTFLYAGDIVEENKNVSGIVNAFSKVVNKGIQNVRLDIIGDGNDLEFVQSIVPKCLSDKVNFYGNQSHEFTMQKLQNSHVLLLNSRFETFSIICAEAMACGVPVITSKCGGPESFISKKASIFIDIDCAEELVNAMVEIKDDYNNYALHINDMKESVKQFSMKEIGQVIKEIYLKSI